MGNTHQELLSDLGENLPGYEWGKEIRFDASFKRADIFGKPYEGDHRISIEIEVDRATFVRKIIKTWLAWSENPRRILLVQLFSPAFCDDKPKYRDEANFIGAKAQFDSGEQLIYKRIELYKWPVNDSELINRLVKDIRASLKKLALTGAMRFP